MLPVANSADLCEEAEVIQSENFQHDPIHRRRQERPHTNRHLRQQPDKVAEPDDPEVQRRPDNDAIAPA